MLFDSKPMWSAVNPASGVKEPFIDVLFYSDRVIGATSPSVLVFTGANRGLPADTPLMHPKTKLLDDPLNWSGLRRDDKVALYHFVQNMDEKFTSYFGQFVGVGARPKSDEYLPKVLETWLREIESSLGASRDYTRLPKPTFREMEAPFDVIFNIEQKLWGANGKISIEENGLGLPKGDKSGICFAPEQLLASAQTTLFEIPVMKDDEKSLGVHLLRIEGTDRPRFFTLPLSATGLAVFENSLESLLNHRGDDAGTNSSRLSATMDGKGGLTVTLDLDFGDGVKHGVERKYQGVEPLQGSARVMCWPDFVHKDWHEYYLYSEVPHNGRGVQAFPLRGDAEAARLMRTEGNGASMLPEFASAYRNGDAEGPGAGVWDADNKDSIELLIGVDQTKLNDSDFLYEVYRSKRPFKGLLLRKLQQDAGYIVFRNPEDAQGPAKLPMLQRLSGETRPVARVGVDFGSNNTCVSFFIPNRNMTRPQLVKFRNRRRFLLGRENESGADQQVTPGEGFFFQNEEVQGNAIKSMVTIHDSRRLIKYHGLPEAQQLARLQKAVVGGVPFFERNVAVEESTTKRHRVRFGSQTAEILFDMKWTQDDVHMAHQRAFLRTLWLKVWAELFAGSAAEEDSPAQEICYPANLVWAVPSAMSQSMVLDYHRMWEAVVEQPPVPSKKVRVASPPSRVDVVRASKSSASFILADEDAGASAPTTSGGNAYTESKAVSRYAAFCRPEEDRVSFETNTYHIGLDVGGSTTDFLCLVARKNDDKQGYKKTLIKEGSIRLAAGSLATATGLAPGFKIALERFCSQSPNFQGVPGLTKGPSLLNPSTAPYYFNLILDRMEGNEFRQFYSELRAHCPELLILNAFVTGFIMFHTGQLAHRVHRLRQEPGSGFGEDSVKTVSIAPYGKGGRIFDWLPQTVGHPAKSYYKLAFQVGFGLPAKEVSDPEEVAAARALLAIAPTPEFKDSQLSDAKREVAFGLAYEGGDDDIVSPSDKLRDMVGERGYLWKGARLDEWVDIDSDQLEQIGGEFKVPETFERLGDFLTVFERFVEQNFSGHKLNTADLMKQMKLASFVENDQEGFQRAKREVEKGRKFDFTAPLIVLEAMCFLEVLKTSLFKKKA